MTEKNVLVEQALHALAELESIVKSFDEVNIAIRKVARSDFDDYRLTPIHTGLQDQYVKLLDTILGDEIASYYLYEASMMKGGGFIEEYGVNYKLRNLEDVRVYVYRERKDATIVSPNQNPKWFPVNKDALVAGKFYLVDGVADKPYEHGPCTVACYTELRTGEYFWSLGGSCGCNDNRIEPKYYMELDSLNVPKT